MLFVFARLANKCWAAKLSVEALTQKHLADRGIVAAAASDDKDAATEAKAMWDWGLGSQRGKC